MYGSVQPEAYDPPDLKKQNLCQHLHTAYDDKLTFLDDEDQQMEDVDE